MGRVSVVRTETRYTLEITDIEPRWGGEIFHTRQDRAWGPPNILHKGY